MDLSKLDFNRILQGMIRAARLDKDFFEEVEHDSSYASDALAVVILVSLLGGLGSFLGTLFTGSFGGAIGAFFLQVVIGVAGYYLWVFVAQLVGTRFFKGTGDFGEVQRAFGFAYAPQVLNLLNFIPCAGWLVGMVAWIWSLAAGFVAIRQSLDQDDTNAALTVIVSGLAVIILSAAVTAVFAAIGLAGSALSGIF